MSDAATGKADPTRRLAYRIDAADRLCRVNRAAEKAAEKGQAGGRKGSGCGY